MILAPIIDQESTSIRLLLPRTADPQATKANQKHNACRTECTYADNISNGFQSVLHLVVACVSRFSIIDITEEEYQRIRFWFTPSWTIKWLFNCWKEKKCSINWCIIVSVIFALNCWLIVYRVLIWTIGVLNSNNILVSGVILITDACICQTTSLRFAEIFFSISISWFGSLKSRVRVVFAVLVENVFWQDNAINSDGKENSTENHH